MSIEFSVDEDVKELVNNIIARENIQNISEIKYQPGSNAGDGYISRTIAADITHDEGVFRLFVKSALNIKSTDDMPIENLYKNEIYFYTTVYPTYLEFCKRKGMKELAQNIPICYGTSRNLIALENIKERHFTLCDNSKCMNDNHTKLVLEAFAKFHAISFAFKDQERQKYYDLVEGTYDFFSISGERPFFEAVTYSTINEFISKLDVVQDKHILSVLDENMKKELFLSTISANKTLDEYSILMQGDCRYSNMMFTYEDENKNNPEAIMLIDWQCIRPASPVFDLVYFFYPVASKEALDNLSFYLKFYHEKLSENIRLLGSNPQILYPYKVLEKEWKQHSKYGFIMAYDLIRMMLTTDGDKILNLEEMDFEVGHNATTFMPKIQKEEEFLNRMRVLSEHMIRNDFF